MVRERRTGHEGYDLADSRSRIDIVMRRRTLLLAPIAPFLLRRASAASTQPNVLLVIASGWRGQAVPWAADADFAPPNLAQFARESTTFARTYAGYARLIPARRILLDGRFAHTDVLPEVALDELSLGAHLKAAGYRASRFGDGSVHTPSAKPRVEKLSGMSTT